MKIVQVKPTVPADIVKTLFSARDSIAELFTKFGMKGERIRLLLVILPEDRYFHGMAVIFLVRCTFDFLGFLGDTNVLQPELKRCARALELYIIVVCPRMLRCQGNNM